MLYTIVDFVLSPVGTIVTIAMLIAVGVGGFDIRNAWKESQEIGALSKKGQKYVQRRKGSM